MIKVIFIALSWSLLFVQTSALARQIIPDPSYEDILFLNCIRSDDSKIDERKIHQVINRKIDYFFNGRERTVSLSGETVRVQVEDGDDVYSVRIDRKLEGSPLDISLRFAYFEGELFLYWSETYENRPARYGLIEIDSLMDPIAQTEEQSLKEYCTGTKGMWVE